ncbi:MAG: hypothetical protein QW782_09070 [Candidatus Bathyarchaeia archaeon]
MSKTAESLSKGLDILMKNPILLTPYAVPIIIQWIFNALARLFPLRYYIIEIPNPSIDLFGSFIAAILGFIAACMLVDMANDAFSGRQIDLSNSLSFVINRIWTLIFTAVIAALCCITIILLPIAIFIIVIAIIEGLSVIESAKRTFDFVLSNLREVIIFVVVVVVIEVMFSYGFSVIPFIGPYIEAIISWLLNAVFTVSAVYFYLSLRPSSPPPSAPTL